MAVEAQLPFCGLQDWIDNGGCGVGDGLNHFVHSYLQQQQQQQQQKYQQQQCNMQMLQNQHFKNQNLWFDNNCINSDSSLKNTSNPSTAYSSSMAAAYDQQQIKETDHYIRLQNERLRFILQEQRKQHFSSLMRRIESKALPLLGQKDEEIAQLSKRTSELEEFLRRLEMENQAWQRVAQENEAMVISLNNTIDQLREKATNCCFDNNGAEDAESCCDMNREDEAEETGQRNRTLFCIDDVDDGDNSKNTEKKKMMVCKGCNSRNSCVLFLPCRHLCSCKACEAFLDSCPVCQTVKNASIEALIV